MDLGLKGKVAAVAAASKGLGRAVATEFAREGARVAICAREKQVIERVADEIAKETRGDVLGVPADLSQAEDCKRFIAAAVQRFGALDALVVNAGGQPPGGLDQLDASPGPPAVDLNP